MRAKGAAGGQEEDCGNNSGENSNQEQSDQSNAESNSSSSSQETTPTLSSGLKYLMQMRCFHTDEEDDQVPYELDFQILQERYIKKRILTQLYETFESYIKSKTQVKHLVNFKE